ncbi:Tll0287-like domain-containing protein [Desulfosediminicola flagellatus]|uniref:Tll0287-like domain-containing protein n=1 Tax=Desulfosediminicola flagellatus TaxID=2569541 RepID=UPI00142EAA76|nr:DUF3365 domain-containing protein [Desulfosediminicola flagellatus]
MSIRIRFIVVIAALSFIAIGGFAWLSYSFTYKNSLQEARNKGEIVSTFLEASRSFYRTKQRPLIMDIVDKERFYPEIMSGFTVTRGVWEEFSGKLPDYKFKQASIDPLYPLNKADSDELKLIQEFDANKILKKKEGIIEKKGAKFFYYAQPITVKEKCLRCHGDPKDAPEEQRKLYGTTNGYHWVDGATVATYITYVPIKTAVDAAKKSALTLFGYGLAGIVCLSGVIWFFFEKRIIAPIVRLEKRTSEISLGKKLEEKIIVTSGDEIGSLGNAIERLRISVLKLMEHYKKNS